MRPPLLPQAGFDQSQDKLDVAERLNGWQQAADPRLWKLILSPEFGEKLDMQTFARGVMERVERELGTGVEWVGVAHHNTGHPHVHVAMRGIDRRGRELRLPRVRKGFANQQRCETLAGEYFTDELADLGRKDGRTHQRLH